mmetsp:Transcript_102568/g.316519  ORF Transcript_102568/g.316519 Transcript_102568/m.316519 type:complete len:331 (-) Transcript_102568:90-1082(-)
MPADAAQRRRAAHGRKRALTKFEREWGPTGLALGTCGLVIMDLFVAHLLLRRVDFEYAALIEHVAQAFGVSAICCCLACHFVDPGSPEPDPRDPAPQDEADDALRIREQRLPDGRTWRQKWCKDCRLWRPHRCGHCSFCERCILRLDHHCGFMGNCVGERNFRFFAAFLLCTGMWMVSMVLAGFRALAFLGCSSDPGTWFRSWEPLAIVMLLCCFPCPLISPIFGTPAITGAGIFYTCVILADTDAHSVRQSQSAIGFFRAVRYEISSLLACRGFRIHCCAPLAVRGPCCHSRRPAQEPHSNAADPSLVGARHCTSPRPGNSDAELEAMI